MQERYDRSRTCPEVALFYIASMSEQQELTLRPATRNDLDDVARVWHASALDMDGASIDMPSRSDLRNRIDTELASGWQLHVAIRRERIVGMLAINPDVSVLDQLFILPGEQRAGVGRALLNLAKQAMPGGFTLRMASSNESGRHFYEAEGLKLLRTGVHPRTGAPSHFYGWNSR